MQATKISVHEVKARLDRGDPLVFLDNRSPKAWDESHEKMPGAIRVPADEVDVQVVGIQLVDPTAVREQPQPGQGHLQYQVDDGPVIATAATKLSFHELKFGQHKITVILAGNDHKPLGPMETLTVTIPHGGNVRAQRS